MADTENKDEVGNSRALVLGNTAELLCGREPIYDWKYSTSATGIWSMLC